MSKEKRKFVVDVRGLSPEKKQSVWNHFWDRSKGAEPSDYEFRREAFFHVYETSTYPGNIARSFEELDNSRPAVPVVKPSFKKVVTTTYECDGIDAPMEIEVGGVRYKRA